MNEDVNRLGSIDWVESGVSRSKNILDSTFCPHLRVRLVELDPMTEFEIHEHDMTQILYFIDGGDGIVELDFKEYKIEKDLVIRVRPGMCHGVKNNGEEVLRVIVFEEQMKTSSSQTPYIDF